ncbi:MAG: HAD-IB family hydrolase [Actinomycetota bacterium]
MSGHEPPDRSGPPHHSDRLGRPVVAAFDVDGTLTVRDCVVPFMRRMSSAAGIAARLAVRPHLVVPAAARRDRDRIKELAAAAAFTGLREREVRSAGVDFARHVHDRWLRSDVVQRLRQHQHDGATTVLVSASFEAYLEPLAELLGVDGVVATRLVSDGGILTGALDGANCRGPEKVRRLHAWLAQHRADVGGRPGLHVVAYGDSPGDRELLADADEAHWVSAA